MDKLLEKAIYNEDINKAQAVIEAFIGEDRRNKSFQLLNVVNETESRLKNKEISLFENDNGEEPMPPNTEWEKHDIEWGHDLWRNVRASLRYNFSKKKINFIVNLMEFLREKGHPQYQPRVGKENSLVEKTSNNKPSTNIEVIKKNGGKSDCLAAFIFIPVVIVLIGLFLYYFRGE